MKIHYAGSQARSLGASVMRLNDTLPVVSASTGWIIAGAIRVSMSTHFGFRQAVETMNYICCKVLPH